VSVATWQHSG